MRYLSEVYQTVMKRAKSICIGEENEYWEDIKTLIKPCADFMLDRINAQKAQINFTDPSKSITLKI